MGIETVSLPGLGEMLPHSIGAFLEINNLVKCERRESDLERKITELGLKGFSNRDLQKVKIEKRIAKLQIGSNICQLYDYGVRRNDFLPVSEVTRLTSFSNCLAGLAPTSAIFNDF